MTDKENIERYEGQNVERNPFLEFLYNHKKSVIVGIIGLAGYGLVFAGYGLKDLPQEIMIYGPAVGIAVTVGFLLIDKVKKYLPASSNKYTVETLSFKDEGRNPRPDSKEYEIGEKKWQDYEKIGSVTVLPGKYVLAENVDMDNKKIEAHFLDELNMRELLVYKAKVDELRDNLAPKYADAEAENVNQGLKEMYAVFDGMNKLVNILREKTQISENNIAEIVRDEEAIKMENGQVKPDTENLTVQDMKEQMEKEE